MYNIISYRIRVHWSRCSARASRVLDARSGQEVPVSDEKAFNAEKEALYAEMRRQAQQGEPRKRKRSVVTTSCR